MASLPFTVRDVQLQAFRQAPLLRFETQLVGHFARCYPYECEALGPDQLRMLVRLGVARAGEHGCTSQRDAALFVNLMIMLGSEFATDPQIPWAGERLRDPAVADPGARMRRLFDAALEYLQAIAGDDNRRLVRAMVRIRDFDLREVADVEPARLPDVLAALLRRFHPEKTDAQGDAATRALIGEGVVAAGRDGLTTSIGATVYVTLMFMLGSGFARDPMYPWAARWLADPSAGTAERKAERLHRAALVHLRESLGPRASPEDGGRT